MRIEKIRILGFKSFARKTELVLDPGITAIVGPNGCGKSNVIDAVKWVLGEQRPSSLRAKEMMDVIFAGSDSRKALGLAEVSLVFDNEDGMLPVEHREVVLTRRLYRSGESEYLVNGQVCRLKDLRDVLMDTGSGLDALSIMEQGKIDAVLTANPAERRTVFEEAAGIGRFKTRRKETLRRLERIADDLTRLRDVIEITEKQLRSLRYQASRATRHRELSDELRKKRVTWALYRYDAFLAERETLSAKLGELSGREAEVNAELRSILESLGGEESSFEELGHKLADADATLLRLDSEIRSAGERAEYGRNMAAELSDRVDWYAGEIRATERRVEDLKREHGALADELAALGAEVELREAELRREEESIAEARAAENGAEAALRNLRRSREALLGRRTELRNERATVQSRRQSGQALIERIDRRERQIEEEAEALVGRIEAATAEAAGLGARESELTEKLSAAEEDARSLESRLEDLSAQATASDRKLTGARSRLEVLTNLKARHEGMDQPVKQVLEAAEAAGTELSGVKGVVADLIRVTGPDAAAVELALGACAQGIVTETMEDARRAIAWLKEKKLGRALFLPLSEVREAGPSYSGNGVARSVLGSVNAAEEYEPLVRALLSDSIYVTDLDQACRVANNGGRSLRIVTGGGEVLGRIGNIVGGRGRAGAALLSRNAEIESLTREVGEEAERRSALEEALVRLRDHRKEAVSEVRVLREERELASREAREAESRRGRVEEDKDRLAEEKRVLAVERAEVRRESEEAGAREAEIVAAEAALAGEDEQYTRDAESREADLRAARERSAVADEQRTEVRVALARARERRSGAEARLEAIGRARAESEREIVTAKEERESCARRRDQSRLDAEVADRERVDAEKKKERSVSEVGALRREHETARETLLARRRDAEGLRERHEEYRTALEGFRLKESEIRLKLEGLVERIRDEFELDLADLHEGFRPEEIDWNALETEVNELKARLDRMGNVNLEAIDQLKEVEERVAFLNREEADLLASKDQLMEILRKVNRESRERFERAFEEIRVHFREMYRKLFGGGTADIVLEEGQDILEAGIEIVCRPPGRELQNLNLLSGGEKTLTAVALLFAIFKARPSPFALMDEVDAALDETNIDRFLSVLREFTDGSQFVIITHHKRTMAFADALYGVSMPEAGVSEPVSIRFAGGNGQVTREPEQVPA